MNIIDTIQLSGVTYTLSAQTSGEGKSVEAGRGIDVASGTSAYTVSFNLPISAGTGSNSIAEGNYTQATGGQSHAEGDGTIANGISSHAEGASTTASGICSHAEGYYTQARGNNSHAEGDTTSARGNDSHAEGCGTIANGNYSHAEGYNTLANSNYSHAEGYNTSADGNYSHAEGNYAYAIGSKTHAEGSYTRAINEAEHASGQYNVSSKASTTFGNSGNTLFSVGNGTADNARHNAFEIRQNGDIYISSGGTDIKLQDNLGGGGGNPTVELTQAEYDALVSAGTVSADTFYIITDAQPVDISNYWTSAQTNSAINAAVSGKVDTSTITSSVTSASTNSEIPTAKAVYDAVGSGGGGKAIEAGRGISITTGETADTVSFDLPISAGTGTNALIIASDTYKISDKAKGSYSVSLNGGGLHANYAYGTSSFAQGMDTRAYGTGCFSEGYASKAGIENNIEIQYAHAEGDHTEAKGTASHAEGSYTIANNWAEHASGRYNNSVSASTTFGDSGNTLFSVGNGTAYNARHNAFEIRQNGDIYLSLNGQDVKLQDQLGGSSITVDTALDSGSTNPVENRVIYNKIDEVEQVTAAALNNINDRLSEDEEVTAAGLNAVNDKFDGLKLKKLSQAEYNALATKDSSTLYIIVN